MVYTPKAAPLLQRKRFCVQIVWLKPKIQGQKHFANLIINNLCLYIWQWIKLDTYQKTTRFQRWKYIKTFTPLRYRSYLCLGMYLSYSAAGWRNSWEWCLVAPSREDDTQLSSLSPVPTTKISKHVNQVYRNFVVFKILVIVRFLYIREYQLWNHNPPNMYIYFYYFRTLCKRYTIRVVQLQTPIVRAFFIFSIS
jgi:hypothetical protein